MGIESSVGFIADLNEALPLAGDSLGEADNHIRNLKTALKASMRLIADTPFKANYSASDAVTVDATKNFQLYINTNSSGSVEYTLPSISTVGTGFVCLIMSRDPNTYVRVHTAGGSDYFADEAPPVQFLDVPLHGLIVCIANSSGLNWSTFIVLQGAPGYLQGDLVRTAKTIGVTSMPLPANSSGPASGNAAATTLTLANGATVNCWAFDATTPESIIFQLPMPTGWNTSIVGVELIWSHINATPGQVVWGVSIAASGDDLPLSEAFGTEVASVFTNKGNGDLCTMAGAAIWVASSVNTVETYNNMLLVKVRRVASDSSDTLGTDAYLIGGRLLYGDNYKTEPYNPV